jgi:hypothetical protein
MIVLAISGLILTSAVGVFKGQNSRTGFDQSAQDLASEITTRIKEVGNNLFSSIENYTCIVTGSPPRAVITTSTVGEAGTNQDCLLVGKSFEVENGSGNLYTYTVLGNRQTYSGISPTGLAGNLNDANPVAADDTGTNLTVTYNLTNSVRVAKSTVTFSDGTADKESDLVSYYIDLSGTGISGQNSSSSGSLTALAYPDFKNVNHDTSSIDTCIKAGLSCQSPISAWHICLQEQGGTKEALIDITSTTSGVQSKITYESCS